MMLLSRGTEPVEQSTFGHHYILDILGSINVVGTENFLC